MFSKWGKEISGRENGGLRKKGGSIGMGRRKESKGNGRREGEEEKKRRGG